MYFQPNKTLSGLNKELYFSLTPLNICVICNRSLIYQQDVPALKFHCQSITLTLQQYLSPDPTHIITTYMDESGFVCHFCEIEEEFTKKLHQAVKNANKYKIHIFRSYNECLDASWRYVMNKNNIRYMIFKIDKQLVKSKTFLSHDDILTILLKAQVVKITDDPDVCYSHERGKVFMMVKETTCPLPEYSRTRPVWEKRHNISRIVLL